MRESPRKRTNRRLDCSRRSGWPMRRRCRASGRCTGGSWSSWSAAWRRCDRRRRAAAAGARSRARAQRQPHDGGSRVSRAGVERPGARLRRAGDVRVGAARPGQRAVCVAGQSIRGRAAIQRHDGPRPGARGRRSARHLVCRRPAGTRPLSRRGVSAGRRSSAVQRADGGVEERPDRRAMAIPRSDCVALWRSTGQHPGDRRRAAGTRSARPLPRGSRRQRHHRTAGHSVPCTASATPARA